MSNRRSVRASVVICLCAGACVHSREKVYVDFPHVSPCVCSVVYSVAFTKEGSGRRVITGGHDKCVCVWNSFSGLLLQRMNRVHSSYILGLDTRFDGLQFVSASGDHSIGKSRAFCERSVLCFVLCVRARTPRARRDQ